MVSGGCQPLLKTVFARSLISFQGFKKGFEIWNGFCSDDREVQLQTKLPHLFSCPRLVLTATSTQQSLTSAGCSIMDTTLLASLVTLCSQVIKTSIGLLKTFQNPDNEAGQYGSPQKKFSVFRKYSPKPNTWKEGYWSFSLALTSNRDRIKAVWIFNVTDTHTASYTTVLFPNHTFINSSSFHSVNSLVFAQFATKIRNVWRETLQWGKLHSHAEWTMHLLPLVKNAAIKAGAQRRSRNPFGFLSGRNLVDLSDNIQRRARKMRSGPLLWGQAKRAVAVQPGERSRQIW